MTLHWVEVVVGGGDDGQGRFLKCLRDVFTATHDDQSTTTKLHYFTDSIDGRIVAFWELLDCVNGPRTDWWLIIVVASAEGQLNRMVIGVAGWTW